jgi:hypothetical protein
MRVIGLCGAPGMGKTTIIREVIAKLNIDRLFSHGTLIGQTDAADRVVVLGKYAGGVFDGTDTLSMAVINDAEDYIRRLCAFAITVHEHDHTTIIFEGDRLWCPRWIEFLMGLGIECHFFYVVAPNDVWQKRLRVRALQGNCHTVSFIQSRVTKYRNLLSKYPVFKTISNQNEADLNTNVQTICNLVEE